MTVSVADSKIAVSVMVNVSGVVIGTVGLCVDESGLHAKFVKVRQTRAPKGLQDRIFISTRLSNTFNSTAADPGVRWYRDRCTLDRALSLWPRIRPGLPDGSAIPRRYLFHAAY